MKPTLPAEDPLSASRASKLEQRQREIAYTWDVGPGIALATAVPKDLGYSASVVAQSARYTAAAKANRVAVDTIQRFSRDKAGVTTLTGAASLFEAIDAPALAARLHEGQAMQDRLFAWQRLAGANPFILRRIHAIPDNLPLDPVAMAAVLGDDPFDKVLAEGRFFIADYARLEGVSAGVYGEDEKFLAAPIALFAQRTPYDCKPRGAFIPVAIQCGQTPGPDTPVLTPLDGVAWQLARAVVQVADCTLQENFYHLGRAHFLTEAFAVAAVRQLAAVHPLYVLLSTHFSGTMAINDTARTALVQPGGEVDTLLAPTLEQSLQLVRDGVHSFRLADALPDADLEARGLLDREALPVYPWRDDALPIWRAIQRFVDGYIDLYYRSDEEVLGDSELAAWIDEIRSDQGGRIKGVDPIRSKVALSQLVSWIIFNASVMHAAVNYTQYDFMGWTPNMPAAGYGPPPTRATTGDIDAAWSALLPRLPASLDQIDFFYKQSFIRANTLGEYDKAPHDPRALPLIVAFRRELERIDTEIAAVDADRLHPYPYLRPRTLTASIHV